MGSTSNSECGVLGSKIVAVSAAQKQIRCREYIVGDGFSSESIADDRFTES